MLNMELKADLTTGEEELPPIKLSDMSDECGLLPRWVHAVFASLSQRPTSSASAVRTVNTANRPLIVKLQDKSMNGFGGCVHI